MAPWQMLEFTGNAPLPRELATYLGDRISQGIFQPGEKLPTERELASRFDVSRKTVRLALSELERQGFIFRRVGKGTFVKRGVGSNGSGTPGAARVVLVSFKYTNPYADGLISHLFEGMNRELEKSGCNLAVQTLGATGEARGRDAACRRLVEQLKADRPDGIIFAAEPTSAAIGSLSEVCPVLQAGYFIEGEGAGYVGADMHDGMTKAISFLKSMGHRRIALIAHSADDYEKYPTIADRADVYRRVMEEVGLGSAERVIAAEDLALAFGPDFDHTAVITTATWLARDFLEGARERGVDVPGDLSLISYDDAAVGEGTVPRFTSMKHLSERMGRLAAEKLLGIVSGTVETPVAMTLPAELIVRESCAPPKGVS